MDEIPSKQNGLNIRYDTILNIIPHVLKKQSQQVRIVKTAVKAQADVPLSEKSCFHS
jgi:hypothetical protein